MKQGGSEALLAREKMIEGSLSLVNWVIKKYNFINMDYDDQFQEGSIALIKAIDGYDGGSVFTSYAIISIERAIRRSYNTNENIKISEEAQRVIYYAGQIENGDITFDELSPNIQKNFKRFFSNKTYKEILAMKPVYSSLDSIQEKSKFDLFQPDLFQPNFSLLTEEEEVVIKLYFGFDGDPVSLNKISVILGKSRRWVSDTYKTALAKIKENL